MQMTALLGGYLAYNLNFRHFFISPEQRLQLKTIESSLTSGGRYFTPEQLLPLIKHKFVRVWSTVLPLGCQLAALESFEKQAQKLIRVRALIDTKLQTREHKHRVAHL